ncbi:MAG: deoxyhypusine synthase family protein [Candidatus Omnitrophota bacterium]|nr:deoxyhypusine synthase family protein [Candidatus Omnitrophota bacterium]
MDLSKLKTYSLKKRKSKVALSEFAKVCRKGGSFRDFYASLPKILAAENLHKVTDAIAQAAKAKKQVIFMAGAHVIKCGLSPLIIDLVKRKVIKCVVLNGAGIIHDFEIAYAGFTSEDVAEALKDGSFGMAKETAEFINNAITDGSSRDWGLGRSVAEAIQEARLPNRDLSILYNCLKYKVPVCVQVAIGTDIVHMHPSCDGAAVGEASLKDFHLLISEVVKLEKGVLLNFGSAVILPEVFLKALAVARNLGYKVKDFTAANFDMIYHYRPQQNVVSRPTQATGKGYYIVGHHEIMLPLLTRLIIEKL